MTPSAAAYEREPYRRELDVEILECGPGEGEAAAWAILDDTLIYPEGGGQPADQGQLGPARVVGAKRQQGVVHHLLDRPVATGPARLSLDWARRHDHMQQHTAQHLLTAVAVERFGWRTTAFHLASDLCSIDLDTPPPDGAELEALEAAAREEIGRDRPVTARRVSAEDFARLLEAGEVRSRRLPEGHRGEVRLVEIEGLDVNTCGGTHVASLGEIATLKLLSVEAARGGCRLSWVAGDRVRRRLGEAEQLVGELRRVFETSAAELPAVARLKLDQLRLAERRARALEVRWAEAAAERLAASGEEPAVAAHFDDVDGAFLQRVARAFSALAADKVALLTAAGENGEFFAVAGGESCGQDVSRLGRAVAELLDGRGGGSGRLFQGKAGGLARRDEAVAALSAAGTSEPPRRR